MDEKTVADQFQLKEKRDLVWYQPPKRSRWEELLKNMSVAATLVLCAVALKNDAVPGTETAVDAVLASVADDTLLDDRLGKLTFVSKMLPEATLVFGEGGQESLAMPVSGGVVVHAWSQQEPYMTWRSSTRDVQSAGDGVVMGIFHGEDEELLVQVMGDNGVECVYGNLAEVYVQPGETIAAGDAVGVLLIDQDCVFEVRVDGVSTDPAVYLGSAL